MESFDPAELPELLKLYYRRLFPYSQYYRWLNYGGGDGGGRRAGTGLEAGLGGVLENDVPSAPRASCWRFPTAVQPAAPTPAWSGSLWLPVHLPRCQRGCQVATGRPRGMIGLGKRVVSLPSLSMPMEAREVTFRVLNISDSISSFPFFPSRCGIINFKLGTRCSLSAAHMLKLE